MWSSSRLLMRVGREGRQAETSELPIPTDIELWVEENNTVHVSFTAVRNPEDHSQLIDDYKVEISTSSDVLSASWTQEEYAGKTVDLATSQVGNQ